MAQIRSDMRQISSKVNRDLEEIQQTAAKGFSKLRKLLRVDQVEFQEANMRFRRNCRTLKEQDAVFKEDFETTKPRLDVLQDDIFSTRPFDLNHNSEFEHQFPQEYF